MSSGWSLGRGAGLGARNASEGWSPPATPLVDAPTSGPAWYLLLQAAIGLVQFVSTCDDLGSPAGREVGSVHLALRWDGSSPPYRSRS
jgi:hypothetical protein